MPTITPSEEQSSAKVKRAQTCCGIAWIIDVCRKACKPYLPSKNNVACRHTNKCLNVTSLLLACRCVKVQNGIFTIKNERLRIQDTKLSYIKDKRPRNVEILV